MMPATARSLHGLPNLADADESVCEDCDGLGCVVDEDGSLSGTVGLIVPCRCAELDESYPVTIGPEDEPVPGYSAMRFIPASAPEPLTAPLSRTDDAEVIPSPCFACGAEVDGWRYVRVDDCLVLTHDGNTLCPKYLAFDWANGEPRTLAVKAVAA
ncbi:hypothetical protein ABZ930_29105 [Streptomyces sp. NPDC046716]|uniref:hypothetical protein n=1 Tax=Streptomyces sp. NPDC046716 TaxID=3157093 RepID=UPI0033F795CB